MNPEADGIHCQNPVLDYPKVIDKKNRIVNKHSKGVEFLLRKNKVEWIKGYARLKGGGRIRSGGRRRHADAGSDATLLSPPVRKRACCRDCSPMPT